MDYALKNILNSKWTLYLEKDYDLKNTLNFEGTKKRKGEVARKWIEQKEGKGRKSSRQLNITL